MIVGCVVFIFCILGIYGYFAGNIVLTYIGLVLAIIEHIIGIYIGEEKGFTTVGLSILCALGMTSAGNNLFESLAICLCFENVICFGLGIILVIVTGVTMSKIQKKDAKNENNKSESFYHNKNNNEEYEKLLEIIKKGSGVLLPDSF